MSLMHTFCNEVLRAHNNQDSEYIQRLFDLQQDDPDHVQLRNTLSQIPSSEWERIASQCLKDTSSALVNAVISYFKMVMAVNTPVSQLYDAVEAFYSALVPVFSSSEGVYLVDYIKSFSSQLVSLAFLVDKEQRLRGKSRKSNGAARLLSKVFNIMLADRAPFSESKRQGIIHITNLAFKIYTKLDNIRLCQTFISNLRTGGVDVTGYSMAEQVTYRYYMGRFQFYQNNLKKADEHFTFAFRHCPGKMWHNKRLILEFLIPTRMILGRMPSDELLHHYQLTDPYMSLKYALIKGDIYTYLGILDQNVEYFTRTFSYLVLRGRGLVLVWRSLLRRAFILTRSSSDDLKMSYKTCYDALRMSSRDPNIDLYDVECMLVSLISQGYIRGYLHHQQQRLICSKTNPFPMISQVRLYKEHYNDDLMQHHLQTDQPEVPKEILDILEEDSGYSEEKEEEYEIDQMDDSMMY
ncbi:hypothetical protein LRAMOSA05350 [Lichtheimia ramosa]|uniref:PCI domain-containing protein n=1 Tax=Lichtheimia ramosa TaxID=688394 RepID=A0A077X2B5_9FUNG|nr:hypothetical protein LRAMOSA05350 [Lichtheimia ramosa]